MDGEVGVLIEGACFVFATTPRISPTRDGRLGRVADATDISYTYTRDGRLNTVADATDITYTRDGRLKAVADAAGYAHARVHQPPRA